MALAGSDPMTIRVTSIGLSLGPCVDAVINEDLVQWRDRTGSCAMPSRVPFAARTHASDGGIRREPLHGCTRYRRTKERNLLTSLCVRVCVKGNQNGFVVIAGFSY